MSFTLNILGSSSALPTSTRFPTAHLLNIDEHFFLIDCGEGTQIQLRKYKLRFGRIHHIFISHLHGDHIYGLWGLISSYGILGRKEDLHIYAPPEIEQIVSNHLYLYENTLPFNIIYHYLNCNRSERIFENDKLFVETIPLKHRIPTCGFLFKEKVRSRNIKKELIELYNIPIREILKIKKGADFVTEDGKVIPNKKLTKPPYNPRSYAYCSDTVFNESIITKIKNVDLLYHEATYKHDLEKLAKETFHSTSMQAATIANKANVKKLLIGHFSARYKDISLLLEEAKSIFENTYAVEDGSSFKVELFRQES